MASSASADGTTSSSTVVDPFSRSLPNSIGQQQQEGEAKYKLPIGLRPLLEAFARETLRTQPTDLAQFGKLFFQTLIEHKERNSSASVDALFSDKFNYDIFRSELHQKLKTIRQPNGQKRPNSPMDIAATKIQALFRGHLVRAHPEKFGLDAESMNGLQERRMRRNSNERLEAADNRKDLKRHSVGGYSHAEQMNATPEDRAATKIQTEIRGYLARKHFEQQKKESAVAATKIQAHIRGFLTRKKLEEQGILSPPRSRASNHSEENGRIQ